MSDQTDPGDVPSPFRSQPASAAPGSAGGGCGKPVFIGCGVLLLVLGIGAVVFVVKAPALFQWWLKLVEDKVTAVVPDDATPDDRAALRKGFADLGGVFRHGGQPPDARYLQAFQAKVIQIISKQKGQVTRQEILDLTRILEQTAGRTPPPREVPGTQQEVPGTRSAPGSGGALPAPPASPPSAGPRA